MREPTTTDRLHASWRRVGRYELGPRLAKGGMAELCIARATGVHGFEKYVVIKRILPKWAGDREFVEMFLDEARLAAQLDHPNVVHVHDLGKDADAPFFAMDYIHGENLLAIIRACRERGTPLAWPAFVAIASAAAAGLHHAHDRCGFDCKPLGIIHRDVSPTNVIASYEGALKLVDFGIAKAATSRHATRPSVRKGKTAYMSPEQCRGDPLDRRSDLFALGIVLYELATLKRAFDGAGEFAVMNQIVNHDIEPPSKRAPVPKEIEAIIMGLLVRDRERRYSTSREVQRAFDAAASMLGLSATPAAIAAEMASLFGSRPYPWALETVASVDPTDAGSSSAAPALNDTPAIEETAATVARARPPRELGSAVPRRNWLGVVAGVAVVSTAVFLLNPRCDGQPSTAATPSLAPVESSKSVAQHPVPQTKPTADPGLATTTPDEPIETEGAKPPPAVPPAPRRSPARRRGSPRGKVGKPRPVEPAEPSKPTFDPDAPAPRPR